MALGSNMDSLLPGRNPTGITTAADYSITPAIGSTSGQNPILPASNIPSGAPATNPYGVSAVPSFGANQGAYTSGSLTGGSTGGPSIGSFGSMPQSSLDSMSRDLSRTYGAGIGEAIMQFLQGGAGFNQQAVNNLFAALQPGYNRAQQDLLQQFSATGNRFGSGAQIGLADLMSQQQLNMGQLETQMYEQSTQDFINTLMGVASTNATRKMNSPSFMDQLGGILNLVGAGAQGASAAGVGGTAGSILDVIGSLGGAL